MKGKINLDRIIEIWSYQLNGKFYEIHVDATDERYIMYVYCEDGRRSDEKQISDEEIDHLEELVNNINN